MAISSAGKSYPQWNILHMWANWRVVFWILQPTVMDWQKSTTMLTAVYPCHKADSAHAKCWHVYNKANKVMHDTGRETSHWPFVPCVRVMWVSSRPCHLRRQEAVLSPFILVEEMIMITDYDQFFCPVVTQIRTGPIFHKTHIFRTFWH